MPPGGGSRDVPYNPQQGMVIPGMQGGRPNQFPMQGQQGGRGGPNNVQGIPQNAFGLPSQLPFGMQQGPGGFPPNFQQFNQAMAQMQGQYGRSAGGRGQPGLQGMQGIPPQMLTGQNVRGRDSRPQYPPHQGGRGGMGMNMQPAQMANFLYSSAEVPGSRRWVAARRRWCRPVPWVRWGLWCLTQR